MDSPARNRVTPLSDIVATDLRGAWMGNRGILHRDNEIVGFHRSRAWIICALSFRDWRAPQWSPGHYTVLFFHDEATALAAGHRPCALCRRPAYRAFREAASLSPSGAADLDRGLHEERLTPGTRRRRLTVVNWPDLPNGAFVVQDDSPAVILGDAVVPWTPAGYGDAHRRPASGSAHVITPPTSLAALRAGYPVQIDKAAMAAAAAA